MYSTGGAGGSMRWHLQAAAPTDCSDNVPSVTVVISMCPKISPILSKVKRNDYQTFVVETKTDSHTQKAKWKL